MAAFPPLTDAVVRAALGPALYERAAVDLATGRLVDRAAYRNGVLTAAWEAGRSEALPAVKIDGSELSFACDCAAFNTSGVCAHCACLALAWARQPHTFDRVNESVSLEELDEELYGDLDLGGYGDEGVDEFDDLDRAPSGLDLLQMAKLDRLGGAAQPPTANALTTQWPDLAAPYAEELQDLTVPQLRALAQRRGLTVTGTKRDPIIQALAAALGNVPAMQAAWQSLSAPARLVLGLVVFVFSDYGANPTHLRQLLQGVSGKQLGQFNAAVQELEEAGLLFRNEAHHYSTVPTLLYFLPPDPALLGPAETRGLREVAAASPLAFAQLSLRLLLALKAEGARLMGRPAPPQHPVAAKTPELAGWPMAPAELDALAQSRNVYQSLAQRVFTVPPVAPLLTDDDLRRLAQTLGVPPPQADFTLRLLVKLGVVGWEPGAPLTVREEGFQQFLGLTPLQHVAPLYNAYTVLNDWTELGLALAAEPALTLKRQVRYGFNYPALLGVMQVARFFFLQLLRRAPAGQWTSVDQLVTRARALNLLHSTWPLPPGIYLEHNGRSLAADNAENWRAFYRPFVEALLAGPLHWLGLVDLGYRKDGLEAVRITDFGALALYQLESYQPPVLPSVGPALQFGKDGALLVAPSAAGPQMLNTLALLGEARASATGQLSYTVTPAGAIRAFQAGWDPDRLLEALAAAAGRAAPAPLAAALRGWWAHFGDVQLYTDVALLELSDDFALTELLASTSLAQHMLYRFSPRVIALRPEGVEALRAELVERGYTPKVVTG